MSARVGLVGARRRRQGLGPYVARDLRAAGLEVPCFLVTDERNLEEARRQLAAWGVQGARGYTRLDEMLAAEEPDALAILSPAQTHLSHLEAAARAGLHVLCEKPLVWGVPGLAARGRECLAAFRARGLLLAENCQWPHVLPAFRRLHPDLPDAPPEHFAMRLSPTSEGEQILGDCLPHAFSLLQALVPGDRPRLEGLRIRARAPGWLELDFDYVSPPHRTRAELVLRRSPAQPRPASFAVEGRLAERRVELPDYTLSLTSGERSVPLPDPLTARVAAFAAELGVVLGGASPPSTEPLQIRLELLEAAIRAHADQVDGSARGAA